MAEMHCETCEQRLQIRMVDGGSRGVWVSRIGKVPVCPPKFMYQGNLPDHRPYIKFEGPEDLERWLATA